jgi:hypothetical protein
LIVIGCVNIVDRLDHGRQSVGMIAAAASGGPDTKVGNR